MLIRQLNTAKESTYLIKVACTRYLLVTLLTKQAKKVKCNLDKIH
jgi:hypothetical protein